MPELSPSGAGPTALADQLKTLQTALRVHAVGSRKKKKHQFFLYIKIIKMEIYNGMDSSILAGTATSDLSGSPLFCFSK